MDKSKFGKFLLKLRRERDLTQTELAGIIGVSHQAVSKWEKGDSLPDIEILKRLCELYGYTLDDLINAKENSVELEKEYRENNRIFRLKLLIGIQLTIIGYLSAYFSASAVSEVLEAICFGLFLIAATVGFMFSLMHYKALIEKDTRSLKMYSLSLLLSIGSFYYVIELLTGRALYNLNDIIFNGPYLLILGVPCYYLTLAIIYKLNNVDFSISKKQILNSLIVLLILTITTLAYRWYDETLRYTVGDYWFMSGYYYGMWPHTHWDINNFILFIQIDISIVIIVLLMYKKFKDILYITPAIIAFLFLLIFKTIDKTPIDNYWLADMFESGFGFFLTIVFLAIVNIIMFVWMIVRIVNHNEKSPFRIFAVISNNLICIGYSLFMPYIAHYDDALRQMYGIDYFYRVHMEIDPGTYTILYLVVFYALAIILHDRLKKISEK